jgi:excisionase family DNA binding protein
LASPNRVQNIQAGIRRQRPPDDSRPLVQLLDVDQVAALLCCSRKSVYRRARQLGGLKLGSRLRFRAEDVSAYLESLRLDAPRHRQ